VAVAPPDGLRASGRQFWSDVAGTYELRLDEHRLLEQACRSLDELADLSEELMTAPVTVPGSMGQPRPNPLLAEVRAHRLTLAKLLSQLCLPDADDDSRTGQAQQRSQKATRAARSRWSSRGA